jgi:hypothetical protein
MTGTRFYIREIVFGLIWGIILTLLVLAPGIVSDSVDFVYANF